jgi:hypothetical protein
VFEGVHLEIFEISYPIFVFCLEIEKWMKKISVKISFLIYFFSFI